MKFFYIAENYSASGFKEVHAQNCPNIPDMHNRKYLGPFNNHKEALRRVQATEPAAAYCLICGPDIPDKII